jgi:hypothetical protein
MKQCHKGLLRAAISKRNRELLEIDYFNMGAGNVINVIAQSPKQEGQQ